MVPIHPGRILRRELKARQLSAKCTGTGAACAIRPNCLYPKRKTLGHGWRPRCASAVKIGRAHV